MYTKLDSCNSIEDVVKLINDDFGSDATREQLAADYAVSCIDIDETTYYRDLDYHLCALLDHDAVFDYDASYSLAIDYARRLRDQ